MNVLNMSFNSINATKKSAPKGKINISNNIKLESIEDANIGVDKANTTLRVKFSFKTEYSPSFAEIKLEGNVIALEEKATAKKILDEWKKNKKVSKDVSATVINHIMNKCSMEIILLARELSLPSPIPLPRVNQNTPEKK